MEQSFDQPDIAKIVNGNSREFSKLVDTYKDLVFTIALRMMKNRDEADEVAQDTFVKVYRNLKLFKGDSKLSTWIYRIAYNTCLDRLKKNKKEQYSTPIDEIRGAEVAVIGNALDALVKEERQVLIKKSIEKLTPSDAALLTLFYFEEKSLQELEPILKLGANAIKVRLFRARGRLATILKGELELEIL
ncbi:MAG: sigma-70 family RNA polymerase sigma factor [Bacteroidota bacterium]